MAALAIEPIIEKVAAAIIAQSAHLTDLDQAIGDGDHGINMKRGMEAVLAELPKFAGKPLGEVLRQAGMQLVMKVGGASGPLYGTLFMELGKALPPEPSRADLAKALDLAVAGVAARGKSQAGQKTLLDVLYPVAAALSAGEPASEIRRIALDSAAATVPMKALRGRASFLGDRSIGHMDPGSYSSALMIATLCDVLEG